MSLIAHTACIIIGTLRAWRTSTLFRSGQKKRSHLSFGHCRQFSAQKRCDEMIGNRPTQRRSSERFELWNKLTLAMFVNRAKPNRLIAWVNFYFKWNQAISLVDLDLFIQISCLVSTCLEIISVVFYLERFRAHKRGHSDRGGWECALRPAVARTRS